MSCNPNYLSCLLPLFCLVSLHGDQCSNKIVQYNGGFLLDNLLLTQAPIFVRFDGTNISYIIASVSELLILQVHQFGLGCIKLSTSKGNKVHPKWYSDWSTCTVFDTTNNFGHRAEPTLYSVVLSTSQRPSYGSTDK